MGNKIGIVAIAFAVALAGGCVGRFDADADRGGETRLHLPHVHRGGGARECPDNTLEFVAVCGNVFSFRARFAKVGVKGSETDVVAADMFSKSVETTAGETRVTWRGCKTAGFNFTVVATLGNGAGDRRWKIETSGAENCGELIRIDFPVVTRPVSTSSEFLCPASQGLLASLPKDAKVGDPLAIMWAMTARYAAFIEPKGPSWYFDFPPQEGICCDSEFRMTATNRVTFTVMHKLPITLGKSARGEASLEGTWRAFEGGWFEATQIYKRRPHVQAIIAAAKKRGNPKSLRDIGLWMWNRGLKENVLPPVLQFQKDADVPAALDWYWWHAIPYDSGYPNFWPPREGVETFRRGVKEGTDAGAFVQVYINGMAWDMDDPSFAKEGGVDEVVRHLDGSYTGIAFNRYDGHRLAYPCGDQPHFKAKHHALLRNLRDSGLSGQYLDQIGCSLGASNCFATNHNHALGASAVPGYRRQVAEYRRMFPGWPLCTEDVSEEFLDLFDSQIVIAPSAERMNWLPSHTRYVPAWSAVYHGTSTLFGNYAMIDHIPPFDPKWPDKDRWKAEKEWEKLYPDQFALELARGPVWGMQPSVHNFQLKHTRDPRFAADYRFMIDTAKFYHANRAFLYDGEMLSPGKMICADWTVRIIRRGIYTKDGEFGEETRKVPAVLHSCWRAPDGKKAAVFVNWTRQEQKFRLETPDFGVIERTLSARTWMLNKMP